MFKEFFNSVTKFVGLACMFTCAVGFLNIFFLNPGDELARLRTLYLVGGVCTVFFILYVCAVVAWGLGFSIYVSLREKTH